MHDDHPSRRRSRKSRLRPRERAVLTGLALVAIGFLGVDRWFYEAVSVRFNTPDSAVDLDPYRATKPLWGAVRFFGSFGGGLAACIAIAALRRRGWRYAVAALAAIAFVGLSVNLLQTLIGRQRPNQSDSAWRFSPSRSLFRSPTTFPSGEVAVAFALATVVSRKLHVFGPVLFGLAILVGLARLLPGMHYVSDVAAGAACGCWLGALSYRWALHFVRRLGTSQRNASR